MFDALEKFGWHEADLTATSVGFHVQIRDGSGAPFARGSFRHASSERPHVDPGRNRCGARARVERPFIDGRMERPSRLSSSRRLSSDPSRGRRETRLSGRGHTRWPIRVARMLERLPDTIGFGEFTRIDLCSASSSSTVIVRRGKSSFVDIEKQGAGDRSPSKNGRRRTLTSCFRPGSRQAHIVQLNGATSATWIAFGISPSLKNVSAIVCCSATRAASIRRIAHP